MFPLVQIPLLRHQQRNQLPFKGLVLRKTRKDFDKFIARVPAAVDYRFMKVFTESAEETVGETTDVFLIKMREFMSILDLR